jgi:pimeloyl-ACP methyl ester carboxylesterase
MFVIFSLSFNGCGAYLNYNNLICRKLSPPQSGESNFKYLNTADVKGVGFHYMDYSKKDKNKNIDNDTIIDESVNIVLLHGFASSTYTWEKMVKELINIYNKNKKTEKLPKIWALDMKGFGWSGKPKGAHYDAVTLMEEVKNWMNALSLKEVVFVGHSLGGYIGLMMALEHPEMINKLILIDSAGYSMEKETASMLKCAHSPFCSIISKIIFRRSIVSYFIMHEFHNNTSVTDALIDAYYLRLLTSGTIDAQMSIIRSSDPEEINFYMSRLDEIDNDSLIIWGTDDPWFRIMEGYKFWHAIRNSTLMSIPGSGHAPQEECPEIAACIIHNFITKDTKNSTKSSMCEDEMEMGRP